MDGENFDDLLKKVCTTRLTRLGMLRGLAAGAMAALAGSAVGSDDADAKKGGGKGKKGGKKSSQTRLAQGDSVCPAGAGPDTKVCHCPFGKESNCQVVGAGGGHDPNDIQHSLDCCCLNGGSTADCECPGDNTCCKPQG